MGAEALVKFLAQRLDYLLSKETENFSGLSGQILQLKSKLDESGCFIQTLDRSKYGNESVRQWIRELRDTIYDVEDLVDQFITGANVSDESEKALLIIRCGSDLESIQVRLTQILDRKPQCDTSASSAGGGHGESSSSFVDPGDQSLALLVSEYMSLPYYLRSCLMYCCVFPAKCGLSKGTLTRIWMAEGIIQAKSGEILEDVAEEYIEKLVSLGLLETELDCRIEFKVPYPLRRFLVDEMMEENFIIACSHSEPIIPATARHVSIHNCWNDAIPNLNDLPIRSLFVVGIRYWEHPKFTFYGLKYLRVLHLEWMRNMVKLPGIGRLKNLQSVKGVYARGSISRELGCLTQLRELGVLNDYDVGELSTSIMKMSGLLSLTLTVSLIFDEDLLDTSEPFSPPPFLRKLQLEGRLVSLPDWLSSTENLTKLRLGFSHLFENPNAVLQFLPNLKHLTLWKAYNAKQIGKEFCPAGGFPKLEVLVIASYNLVEWTEIEKGALPSLKYLHFHSCSRLMILPEGLQYVTTLQKLILFPFHGDHARRLDPERGIEHYKIKHIPKVRFFE
ncbi:disease resistance protein Pik-2-like [Vitis riparia]|uniref:disease resistance protein Pik-2-like n=1 Tax=Vitis riparia TaxID=96939 RepID=UPI00155AA1C0|nr:disease resistance protein Pik-2-like [Vitis riparia]